MELRFVSPDMRQLCAVGGEVLACCMFEDERPVRGLAGLLDWRMAARLSNYMSSGTLSGKLGEKTLIPGKPRIPFEIVLLFGMGQKNRFTERVFLQIVSGIVDTLSGMRVRKAVLERPGRHIETIDAIRATQLIIETCEQRCQQDVWTIVESLPDQKLISMHLDQEKRRKRLR
ncbi:MAG: leucyl aminopeptidase [Polyangiaceae bacterium]|nr:leucyl aminopeptidase [Polyangiaceae bacterium]